MNNNKIAEPASITSGFCSLAKKRHVYLVLSIHSFLEMRRHFVLKLALLTVCSSRISSAIDKTQQITIEMYLENIRRRPSHKVEKTPCQNYRLVILIHSIVIFSLSLFVCIMCVMYVISMQNTFICRRRRKNKALERTP